MGHHSILSDEMAVEYRIFMKKTLIVLIQISLFIQLSCADQPQETLCAARAVVQSINEFTIPRAVGDTNPLMEAVVKIEDVLSGPPSFQGRIFEVYSRAVEPTSGNTFILSPNLKIGDEGIFVFKVMRDGSP